MFSMKFLIVKKIFKRYHLLTKKKKITKWHGWLVSHQQHNKKIPNYFFSDTIVSTFFIT